MNEIKALGITIPSGRSMILVMVVYANTTVTSQQYRLSLRRFSFHSDSAAATAADDISTKTPVAYAPPCFSTLAWKIRVIRTLTPNNNNTSGRADATQFGAIPTRGM